MTQIKIRPPQPHPGTRNHCYRCSLPGLAGANFRREFATLKQRPLCLCVDSTSGRPNGVLPFRQGWHSRNDRETQGEPRRGKDEATSATSRHTKSLLPLLPSGPGGVHNYSLREDRGGKPIITWIGAGMHRQIDMELTQCSSEIIAMGWPCSRSSTARSILRPKLVWTQSGLPSSPITR